MGEIVHKLILRGVFTILLALLAIPAIAEGPNKAKPLEIGIVPYMSIRVLIEKYEPLRFYLEQQLGKPVKIYSANGFKPFYMNAVQNQYDIVITAAHFARLLQNEYHFTPLLRFSIPARALIISSINSPLNKLQDLKGQVIAAPDQLSLASIACMTKLRENGLLPGIDFSLLEVPTFPSAILTVQKNEAAAAFTAKAPLTQMPKELQESVKTIVDAGDYSNLLVIANPHITKSDTDLISNTLLKFNTDKATGEKFIAGLGFGPLIPVTASDMKNLDRYMPDTMRLLSVTN
jgi:phosphonate transport system substrate-binding protein